MCPSVHEAPGSSSVVNVCVFLWVIISKDGDTSLFSFGANGGIVGWVERGTRQLAVTDVSRKQAALCADVQLALGQLVLLLPPTTYL